MGRKGFKISIRKLLIISNCSIMVIFFGFNIILSQRSYQKVLEQEFEEKQHQILVYIGDTLEESMRSIEQLARSVANSHTIINSIIHYRKNENSYEQMVFQNNMSQNLSSFAYTSRDIVSVNILMDNPKLRTTKINGVYDYENYTVDGNDDRIREISAGWIPTRANNLRIESYTNYIFSYVLRIYSDLYYGEAIGHLVINLDEQLLYQQIMSYVEDGGAEILIFDSYGNIMSSTDRSVLGKNLKNTEYAVYRDILDERNEKTGKEKGRIFTKKQLDGENIEVMVVTDYAQAIAPIKSVQRLVLLSSLGLLICFSLFNGSLAYLLSKPLMLLAKEVNNYKGDNWNYKIRFSSVIHEIDVLGVEFNHMAEKIDALITSLLQQEQEKQKKELEILQAQINPHFLYNTLEAVNWMALSLKQKEISRMVVLLGTFLRLSLNKGKNVYFVGDELNHLKCYLEIQNIRCRGKITFSSDIDETILKCKMIKLLLQPIVENSILHGFDARGGSGRIWLRVYRENSYICFCLTDDGCGMSEEMVKNLSDIRSETGHGIKNVMKRISLYYGDGCGVTIRSTPQLGTTVEVRITEQISEQ